MVQYIRWVACPIIQDHTWLDDEGFTVGPLNVPKVALYTDPGTGRQYGRSSVIGNENWCLVFVRGTDFTPLDGDSEIIDILEEDYEDLDMLLAETANTLGWSQGKFQSTINKVKQLVDTSSWTMDTPFYIIIGDIGRTVNPDYPGPYGTWVKGD